jgi:hypothetical protein
MWWQVEHTLALLIGGFCFTVWGAWFFPRRISAMRNQAARRDLSSSFDAPQRVAIFEMVPRVIVGVGVCLLAWGIIRALASL